MKVLFTLGVGLVYLILGTQFRSYFQPLMILLTVPMDTDGGRCVSSAVVKIASPSRTLPSFT